MSMSDLLLTVRAKPNSSRNRVGGSYGEALVVSVTAPAVDGKASAAIIALLARALDIPKGAITVKSGHRARTKILAIDRNLPQSGELPARIAALMAEIGAP